MKITQEAQVIEVMRKEGGFATFKRLNELLDFSKWETKTPEASVRRIVQNSKSIFKIQPGLWALEEMRAEVLDKFNLEMGNKKSEEQFSHGYYQGLLIEIGKYEHMKTYVPAQDKKRLFLGKSLEEISDTMVLPQFTHSNILRKAKTVDVIWFNERGAYRRRRANLRRRLKKWKRRCGFMCAVFSTNMVKTSRKPPKHSKSREIR